MKTTSVSDFRQNLKLHLKQIEADQDILILSGPKRQGFVVMPLEQYEAMEETAHLLSTPANTNQLLKSIAQHKAGKVVIKKININAEAPTAKPRKIKKILTNKLKIKRKDVSIRKRKK